MKEKIFGGKKVLITGATSGIGKAVALLMAKNGASVYLHGRSREKSEIVSLEIREQTDNPKIFAIAADFKSLNEVRQMVSEIQHHEKQFQFLINCAGIYSSHYRLTEDKFEETFQVNYLAHFLLTNLLIGMLKEGRPSHIIHLTSVLHKFTPLDFSNLQGQKFYESHDAYSMTQLARVLFAFELAEKCREMGITSNCIHPSGIDATPLQTDPAGREGASLWAAEFVLRLAARAQQEGITGRYFEREFPTDPDRRVFQKNLRKSLWEYSEELIQGPKSIAV